MMKINDSLIDKLEELKDSGMFSRATRDTAIDECIAIARQHASSPDVVETLDWAARLLEMNGTYSGQKPLSPEAECAIELRTIIAAMGGALKGDAEQNAVCTPSPAQSSEISVVDAAADRFIAEARLSAYGCDCSNELEGDFGSWEDWRKHFIRHYPTPVSVEHIAITRGEANAIIRKLGFLVRDYPSDKESMKLGVELKARVEAL